MRSHIRAYAVGVSVMLFAATASGLQWNVSGEAGTARFWDCCKPSCAWKFKADVNQPVEACAIDGLTRENVEAGTGCNGGKAFQCTDQQPWAVNDTFSYGFAGAYLMEASNELEDAWCCACYQLEFTSDPLLGKTMIVQASNTAYDIHDANWFPLAIPGGNTSSTDGCARQFSVQPSVFGEANAGVNSLADCKRLPEPLREGCEWRFDWFKDASFPSVKFKRVQCPKVLTDKTGCIRKDDNPEQVKTSAAPTAPLWSSAVFAATAAWAFRLL